MTFIKSLPFMDVSNPIFCLERSDWKSSSITVSSLSLIMILMIPQFESILRSSSLSIENTKLIAIVNWIFHVSNFLTLFMVSFKYSLNL